MRAIGFFNMSSSWTGDWAKSLDRLGCSEASLGERLVGSNSWSRGLAVSLCFRSNGYRSRQVWA